MARSTFGVAYIDSRLHVPYPASGIMSRHGFEETDYDGEKVYYKENSKTNTIEYVKFDFDDHAFIYSVWIRFKNDTESYRGYNLEHFEENSEETKDLYKLIYEFSDFFGKRLNFKKMYVYE